MTDHDRADTLVRAGGYRRVVHFRPSARVPESVADPYCDVAGPFGLQCVVTPRPTSGTAGVPRGGRGTNRGGHHLSSLLSRRGAVCPAATATYRSVIHTDHTAGGWFLDEPVTPARCKPDPETRWQVLGASTVHPKPAECCGRSPGRCSYRDVSGGAVTLTPNSAATYAANSCLVGRHPS